MYNKNISPFSVAKVFLSHRCSDHKWSDYLARALKKEFDVYYSCDGGMLLDDPVVPRRQLSLSDITIFLATPRSLEQDSIANHELSIAEILKIKGMSSLAMIQVEETVIPAEYSAFMFGKFSWGTRKIDSQEIIRQVKRKLAVVSGFGSNKSGRVSKDLQFYSLKSGEAIVNELSSLKDGRLLSMNVPFRSYEMSTIIRLIRSESESNQKELVDKLSMVFYKSPPEAAFAKQNAIFILSKLLRGEDGHVDDFKKRLPDHSSPFFHRGFSIALSFFAEGESYFNDYLYSLMNERGREWDAQRFVNKSYHLLYYNGRPGALTQLRDSINSLHPINLLTLNVFTLGELSSYKRDVELLGQQKRFLIDSGVKPSVIDATIQKINLKVK